MSHHPTELASLCRDTRTLALDQVVQRSVSVALRRTEFVVALHEALKCVVVMHPLENSAVLVLPMPVTSTEDLNGAFRNEQHLVRRSVKVFNHRHLSTVHEGKTLETTSEFLCVGVPTLLGKQVEVRTTNAKVRENNRRTRTLHTNGVHRLNH